MSLDVCRHGVGDHGCYPRTLDIPELLEQRQGHGREIGKGKILGLGLHMARVALDALENPESEERERLPAIYGTIKLRTLTGRHVLHTQPYSNYDRETLPAFLRPRKLSADPSTAACTPSHPNNTSNTAATSEDCWLPCRTAT